jgi:hypothetical protein
MSVNLSDVNVFVIGATILQLPVAKVRFFNAGA